MVWLRAIAGATGVPILGRLLQRTRLIGARAFIATGRPRRVWSGILAAVTFAAAFPGWAFGEGRSGPPVVVEGGADAGGRNYGWTVINQGISPIVGAEFLLYRVTTFQGPPGWETSCQPDARSPTSQLCRARASSPAAGVQPGGRANFTAQMAASGIVRGHGDVTFNLAEGESAVAVVAELPVREPLGDRYTSLIGLGIVFLGIFGFRRLRSRLGRKVHPL